ncbi:MAG: hypothetical protein ABT10_19855 [Novosphingobium sp. SCN 63-17]|nr:MAG: hypothetical protein ABT10_19855 [Novosphingobium sp. SCN 63-17]
MVASGSLEAALRDLTMRQDKIVPIDANGELQLPDEVMARHGWRPGSRLVAELVPGGLLLKDAPHEDVQEGAQS